MEVSIPVAAREPHAMHDGAGAEARRWQSGRKEKESGA
jgi:hypothetical protein